MAEITIENANGAFEKLNKYFGVLMSINDMCNTIGTYEGEALVAFLHKNPDFFAVCHPDAVSTVFLFKSTKARDEAVVEFRKLGFESAKQHLK